MNWVIMPYVGNFDQTRDAIGDVLDQTLPDVRLLLINNGPLTAPADWPPGTSWHRNQPHGVPGHHFVHHWHHDPPLPSLSATWNRALRMVWEAGAAQALVCNNDLRIHRQTYEMLALVMQQTDAWFVSAVGVTEEQFATTDWGAVDAGVFPIQPNFGESVHPAKGGPDFSCFVITKECHRWFQFDEGFAPAYAEDCSYHRTLMLAGHGNKIFSVNLPFLHYASGTLKSMTPEARERKERQIDTGSRAHYQRLWGGPPNQEQFIRHGGPERYRGVTNPDLQAAVQAGRDVGALLDGAERIATPDSIARG